ncbi:MAG: type 4a pilus biogenesis protein PilO [Candidatus Omnitrophota bacterium]|nr:type 4a pilus biogenesis protein PilO [Candidatus Omnitrophota bacterium]
MIKLPIDLKNTKQMMAITAVIILGGSYLYVNFIILPQARGVARAYDKVRKIRAEVKISERDISGIDSLKKQMEKYQSKIESYERMLPIEQEVPKLLEELSVMAKSSNVKIIGITPVQPKQETDAQAQIYQEIPILINAGSGYHELGKFLSRLESADRFMRVVDINIKGNSMALKRHDVELLVLTYVLLENK